MRMACDLARRGWGRTSPNPMVGAVLVKGGRVVATGWHRRCGGPHAEVEALRRAGTAARGAVLYVTLEPCGHHGRTPPCVEALVAAGVAEVVVGMPDPNPLMRGRSLRRLRRAGITVRVGVLRRDLERLNEAYITFMTRGRPFILAKIGQTLDGRIALRDGRSRWITSAPARRRGRSLRDGCDAILVGVGTVIADDPALLPSRRGKRLKKIILDPRLRTPSDARLFEGTPTEDIVLAAGPEAPAARREALRRRGVDVIICPRGAEGLDLHRLMEELGRRRVVSVLVEGGGRALGGLLQARLVDKMAVFLAPRIIGDAEAVSSAVGRRCEGMEDILDLKDVRIERVGPDILVEGYPRYPRGRKEGR